MEQIYYIGSKRIKAKIKGCSISGLFSENGKELASLLFKPVPEKQSFFSGKVMTVAVSSATFKREEIRFYDYPGSSVLVRSIAATRPGTFFLKLPSSASVSFSDRFPIGKAYAGCVTVSYPDTEDRLIIGLNGNFRFTRSNLALSFEIGYSDLVFFYGRPDKASEAVKKALRLLEFEQPYSAHPTNDIYNGKDSGAEKSRALPSSDKPLSELAERFSCEAEALMTEGGILLRGLGDKLIRTDGMLEAVPALCFAGREDLALGILKFISETEKKYGQLPLFLRPGTLNGEGFYPGFLSDLAFISALDAIGEKAGEELEKVADRCIDRLYKLSVCGMLPFSGFESVFGEGGQDMPPSVRFHGSLENTLKYRKALLLRIGKHPLSDRLKAELDTVTRALFSSFNIGSEPYENCPERDKQIKHPASVYGRCDICQIKRREKWSLEGQGAIGWLERTGAGFYACPDCLSERPAKSRLIFPPATVTRPEILSEIYLDDSIPVSKSMLGERIARLLDENPIPLFSSASVILLRFLWVGVGKDGKNTEEIIQNEASGIDFDGLCALFSALFTITKTSEK